MSEYDEKVVTCGENEAPNYGVNYTDMDGQGM